MYIEEYVTRIQCRSCLQYLWTDRNGGGVVCKCNDTEIQGDVVIRGGQAVTDEADFIKQVSEDSGELEKDIVVVRISRTLSG